MTSKAKSLFMKGPDLFASQHLKTPGEMTTEIRRHAVSQGLSMAEALLLSPKVTFKVFGENVVLVLLINFFGLKQVEAFLEDGVIEFILWSELVTYMEDKTLLKQGLFPLQPGRLSTTHNVDPFESAELAIKRWGTSLNLDRAARRALSRLAAKRTKIIKIGLSSEAVDLVSRAHRDGNLQNQTPNKPFQDWSHDQLHSFAVLAENALEVGVLLKHDLDIYEGDTTWDVMRALFATINARQTVLETCEELLRVERLPSIPLMILDQAIRFDEVMSLRKTKEAEDFRKWLWSLPDSSSSKDVLEAYMKTMIPQSRWKDSHLFKVCRISTIGIVGGVLGTIAAGPLVGAAGAVLSTGVGLGISLLDGLCIERAISSSNPRRFATDILSPRMASPKMPA